MLYLVTLIIVVKNLLNDRKPPCRGFLRKRRPEKKQQIYRRTPIRICNFVEIAYRSGCVPVNLLRAASGWKRKHKIYDIL